MSQFWATYEKLRCSSGTTPPIYGLPKIHKSGVPLRPIVSFYTSPVYQLSKFLVKLLSPLTGSTESFVCNSKRFCFICVIDVIGLWWDFGFIWCDLFVHKDPGWSGSTSDSKTPRSRWHSPRGQTWKCVIYCRCWHCAWRQPILHSVEHFTTLATPPNLWKRYVDDACSVVQRQQLPLVLHHINSIKPSIQFTHKIEGEDGCLPFLDILLEHCVKMDQFLLVHIGNLLTPTTTLTLCHTTPKHIRLQ